MVTSVATAGWAGSGAVGQQGSPPAGAGSAAGGSATAAPEPAAITVLSKEAAALLGTGAGAGLDLPKDFDDMVQRRTDALASRLAAAFEGADIRTDESLALRVDRYGTVHAEGPQKEKIEKLMRDDPELAKEFRTVATLNALRAVAETLRLHAEDMKAARTPKERQAADDRYAGRSAAIHAAAGSMTLKEGRLVSAAMVYAQSLSDPPSDPREIADVLADRKTDFLV